MSYRLRECQKCRGDQVREHGVYEDAVASGAAWVCLLCGLRVYDVAARPVILRRDGSLTPQPHHQRRAS